MIGLDPTVEIGNLLTIFEVWTRLSQWFDECSGGCEVNILHIVVWSSSLCLFADAFQSDAKLLDWASDMEHGRYLWGLGCLAGGSEGSSVVCHFARVIQYGSPITHQPEFSSPAPVMGNCRWDSPTNCLPLFACHRSNWLYLFKVKSVLNANCSSSKSSLSSSSTYLHTLPQ